MASRPPLVTRDTQLDTSHLAFLLDVLRDNHFDNSKWSGLGLNLGLLKPSLSVIKSNYEKNVDCCLEECLTKWLSSTRLAMQRTVQNLISALNEIGQTDVANKIDLMMKAMAILYCHHGAILQSIVSPLLVCQQLYSVWCVSEKTLEQIEAVSQESLDDKRIALFDGVREEVLADYRKLKVFAQTFLKCKETELLANEVLRDYEHKFPNDEYTPIKPNTATDILRANYAALVELLKEPIDIARRLKDEEVLSTEALHHVESNRVGKINVLLAEVRRAVQTNPQSLETFASVLRNFGYHPSLGKIILDNYKQCFATDVEMEEITVPDILDHKTLSKQSLKGPSTPSVQVKSIIKSMSPQFQSMRKSFAGMFQKFCKTIDSLSLENLKYFLRDRYHHLKTQIDVCTDFSSVLLVIEEDCTLIHIDILDAVAEEFKITDAKRCIEDYKGAIKELLSVKLGLKERLDVVVTHPPLRCETAVCALGRKPDEYTLEDIKDIISELSDRDVKIKYIETSDTITVTCTFPHFLAAFLVAKAYKKLKTLKEKGLVELTIGYITVWDRTYNTAGTTLTDHKSKDDVFYYSHAHESKAGTSASQIVTGLEDNSTTSVHRKENQSVVPGVEVPNAPSIISGIDSRYYSSTDHLSIHGDEGINKIMTRMMNLTEKQSTWPLGISDVKNIILDRTVSCSLFLALVAGLPYCGKSMLIQNFLKEALLPLDDPTSKELLVQYKEDGLSCYGVSILGHKPYGHLLWFNETRNSMHIFSCGSAILHDSLLQDQQVKFTDKRAITENASANIFNSQLLNDHITRVYSDIDKTLQRADLKPELKRILSAGVMFVNIFDVGFSKGILEFLTLISPYGKNRLSYVCMSIDDVQHLNELPNLDYPRYENIKSSALRLRSRLSYIVRFAAAMNLGSNKSTQLHTSFIITADKILNKKEKEEAKSTLQNALAREASRLQLPFLSHQAVVLIFDSAEKSFDDFKFDFENAIKQQSPMTENIKLSWIFLRSALYFSKKVLIPFNELELIAAELNISSEEFLSFLDMFTKFASVLYLPKIKPFEEIVILQPVKFVNYLSRLFKFSDSQFNGIFTQEDIKRLLPQEVAKVITSTLCFLGLATETTADKVDHKPLEMISVTPSPVLFVPLARAGAPSQQSSNESLFIVFESKLPPPDLLGLFVTELLSLRGVNVSLISTTEVNVAKFLYVRQAHVNCIFFLSFRSAFIEVSFQRYQDFAAEMLDKIFQCCTRALTKLSNILEGLTYYFALQCLKPQKGKEYERLPAHQLCHSCDTARSPLRRKWKETVNEMHDKTTRERDRITPNKLLEVAFELGRSVSSVQRAKSLARELTVQDDPEVKAALARYSSWQRVFFILLAWEKKVGRDQVTKQRLSRALLILGHVSHVLKD